MRRFHTTRESWLQEAITVFRGWLAELDVTLPPVLISVGYGDTGARSGVRGCTYISAVSGGVSTVFIFPEQGDDLLQLLKTTLHECVHAADDCASGHRGRFAELVKELGYVSPYTNSANTTPELEGTLKRLAADLGPFGGHRVFNLATGMTLAITLGELLGGQAGHVGSERRTSHGKRQTNRHYRYECTLASGYHVRTSRGMVASYGEPICPCHVLPMVLEGSQAPAEQAAK